MELLSARIFGTEKCQNLLLRKGCAVVGEKFLKQLILRKINESLTSYKVTSDPNRTVSNTSDDSFKTLIDYKKNSFFLYYICSVLIIATSTF